MNALAEAACAVDSATYGDGSAGTMHAVLNTVDVQQLLVALHKALRRAGYRGRAEPFSMASEQALTVYDADAIVCDAHAAQCVPADADVALLTFTRDAYGEPCALVTHTPNAWREPLAVRVALLAPRRLFDGTAIVCAVHAPSRAAGAPPSAAAAATAVDASGAHEAPPRAPSVVELQCLDAVMVAGRCMHADDTGSATASWNCRGFRDRHAILRQAVAAVSPAPAAGVALTCVPYMHPQQAPVAHDVALHIVPLAPRACHYVTGLPTRTVWRARHRVRVVLTAKWMGKQHAVVPHGARGVNVNKPRTGGAGTRMAVAAYTRGDSVSDPWCITTPRAVAVYGQPCDAVLTLSDALEAALTDLTRAVKKHARRGGGTAERLDSPPEPWVRGDARSVDVATWPHPLCAEAVCSVRIVRKGGVDSVHLTPLTLAPHDAAAGRVDTRHALESALSTAYDTPGADAVQVVCQQAAVW
uniref:Uncharacterized protein n=1 Tax=viral metagenome TaxID=1070528 RepID=A0A6C0AT43_9ZZZZ